MNLKSVYTLIILLSFALTGKSQVDSTTFKLVAEAVQSARKQFAPDRRTRLVELEKWDIGTNNYYIKTTESAAEDYLNKHLAPTGIKFSITQFPDPSVANAPHGVVRVSVANLRTNPSHSAELATQLLLGTAVDLLEDDGGDYRVRTPEGYIAWVPKYAVTPLSPMAFHDWISKEKVIYTNEFGWSFKTKDTGSDRVSDLVYGNILAFIRKDEHFVEVGYPDGRKAYIPIAETQNFDEWKLSRKLTADNILRSARKMMGLPYLWGGTSTKGVDCSGFTKTAFLMNGYIIPRDASQQVLVGEAVPVLNKQGDFDAATAQKNLRPGDLIFFAGAKGKRENPRITHVAIYIGNGEFIHAAGAVRVNSFLPDRDNYDDFQTRTLVSARRFIDSNDPQIQQISTSKYY